MTFGPESGAGKLTLHLGEPTAAFQVNSEPKAQQSESICATDSLLAIALPVEVRTAGGALAEAVPAELVAWEKNAGRLTLELDPSRLDGDFSVEYEARGTARTDAIRLELQLEPTSVRGSLTLVVYADTGDGDDDIASSGLVTIACIGAEPQAGPVVNCGP
jgi:hypothetical protein